jgi:hypothetical protein
VNTAAIEESARLSLYEPPRAAKGERALDPSAVATIIAVPVAIYAIIPRERRLDLGVRISKYDWGVVVIGLILVHYIMYFQVLEQLGLVFDLGYWKFGFNESNSTYLVLLFISIYIFYKVKTAKVTRSKIETLRELFEELLLDSKHGEVAILIDEHIKQVVGIKRSKSIRNIIADKIKPPSLFSLVVEEKKPSFLDKKFGDKLQHLSTIIGHDDVKSEVALSILRRVLNDSNFVRHLSVSRPYLAINIVKLETGFTEEFLTLFIQGLMDNNSSVYYYELKHTQNLLSNNRYVLLKSNHLLFYLFNDIRISETLGVYKPIGDKVCDLIDYDAKLVTRYNEPLGTYYEQQKYICPIDTSIHFFEIMIIESMHQGVSWHMWLFYFPTFARKIIKQMAPTPEADLSTEWPTPFHYLLYHMVTVILSWLDEYSSVEDKAPLQMENERLSHDNGSIPKSATLALGNIVFSIISSTMTDQFKGYILEIVVRHLVEKCHDENYTSLNRLLVNSVLMNGTHNELNAEYIQRFNGIYQLVDDHCRWEANLLNSRLEELKNQCGVR